MDTKTLTASGAHADGDMSPGGDGVQSLRRTLSAVVGSDPARRARQFNVEFRVADATASPYLALAMLVQAGLDGIRHHREIEVKKPPPLPGTLSEALTLLEASETAAEWFGADVLSAYLLFKRAEIKGLENLDESEICRRYAEVY